MTFIHSGASLHPTATSRSSITCLIGSRARCIVVRITPACSGACEPVFTVIRVLRRAPADACCYALVFGVGQLNIIDKVC
jgi:hypothetical protein